MVSIYFLQQQKLEKVKFPVKMKKTQQNLWFFKLVQRLSVTCLALAIGYWKQVSDGVSLAKNLTGSVTSLPWIN